MLRCDMFVKCVISAVKIPTQLRGTEYTKSCMNVSHCSLSWLHFPYFGDYGHFPQKTSNLIANCSAYLAHREH